MFSVVFILTFELALDVFYHSSLTLFCTFGMIQTFGVYQDYYTVCSLPCGRSSPKFLADS